MRLSLSYSTLKTAGTTRTVLFVFLCIMIKDKEKLTTFGFVVQRDACNMVCQTLASTSVSCKSLMCLCFSLQQLLSRNSSSPSISVLNLPNSVEVIELSGNAADGRMPVASRNEVASRALHDESGDLHNNRNMGLTEMETEVDSISAVGIQRPQNANVNCSQFSPDNVSCSRAAECESGIQSSLVTIADISCQPSSGSGNNTDTADSGSQMKKSSESTNSAQRLKILDVQANSEQSDKRKSSSNIGKDKKSCMKNKTSGNRLSSFCEKSVVTGEYADKKQMPIGRTGINTDDVSVCEVAPPRKSSAVENGKQDTVPVLEAGIVPVKFESANLMGSIAAVTVENCVLPNSGDTKDISLLLNGAEERVNSSKKLEKVPKASQTMADKFCAAATAASKSESTVTACDASNKENSKLADSRSERCAGACLEPLQQVVGLNEKSECHPALTDVEINCSAPVKSRKEKGPACPAVVSMQVDKTDQSFVPDVNEGNGPNTKKRKRSCLTVDTPAASFPDNQVQHKRLKAAHDNSRCNETPSGDSAAEMSDSERVLQYKASGDQRETESRRSYAEMEHMRRKYMSARPRCDSLKRDEERKTGDAVDAVVSKATDCIRKNENSDVESDKRTARAESGMPSTLSVFTRRCMQKMERDRLGLEESKKQQQTVLGESTTNNHDTVYSKLRRSDNEGIIKPGKQKDEICHSSVGKLVKPGVASSVKPHTNGSFVEKNEPSIEVGDEKRSAVSGICEPSTVAATAAAVPELDSDVSSRRHRENVPASSESVAVRIKSSNRDLASAERVSHEQASLVCHNAASGTAVSSESKQLNSTDENTARASCRTENTSKVYGSSCANAALATIGSAVTDVAVPSADVGHSQPRVYSSAIRRVKKKRTADTSGDKPVSENQVDAQLSIKTDDLSSSFNSKPGKKIPTAFVVESSNRDANFTESCKNSDKDTDQWAAKVAAVETSPLPVSARSSEDILKRLEDLLSTPTQTSGAQVTTSNLIGPTRVDPRLAAKQMREGGGAAERVLSPLGILNSLVAATGNQSTVSDRSELSVCSSSNVKQPPVHNDKFSTEALKISADAKRVDVQVCQTTSGCNSPTLPVTDTELRGAVTRFRDPRDRSMQVGETERLSKILEPNSSSSNRQAPNDDCSARLKNFEDAVKALKRCVSSPCKTESCTAEKIPSVLTENSHQRKNLRLDSATDHNTLTANNATTAEAVTSVDLLDFAIAGTPVDCNDSIAGSVRSPALDSDLCLMNVEDTEIGADDNCDITVMQTFAADDSKSGNFTICVSVLLHSL